MVIHCYRLLHIIDLPKNAVTHTVSAFLPTFLYTDQ